MKQPLKKQIGMIGLGKMGGNIARQLIEKGHAVTGYNLPSDVTQKMEKEGITGAYSLKELVDSLKPPRLVWLMLPAGKVVDQVIFGQGGQEGLINYLDRDDIIIDGGNSFYKDSIRRSKELGLKGVAFTDVGVSGGPEGARTGACLMVGGNFETYKNLYPLFNDLAIKDGVEFFEGAGAGHFVKMVHNGIEYGMMQSIAEGFTILKESSFNISLTKAAKVYNHGSVIESRLMSWLKEAFDRYTENLKEVSGSVGHTGEAEWTVQTAKKIGLKPESIEQAVNFRVRSEANPSYTGKILTALRNQFGKHGVKFEHRRLRKTS